jgi:Protein of unknown function (DUF3572)
MAKMNPKTAPNGRPDASIIALNFITFLASDPERLQRFCNLTGYNPDVLRENLASQDFLAMALDYALQDEGLLLEYAVHAALAPQDVLTAWRQLPGFAG